jgi:hypothetical protein
VFELVGGVFTPTTLAEATGAVVLDGTADVEGLAEVVDGFTEVVEGLTEVLEGLTEVLEGFTEVEEGTVPGASATW